MALIETDNLWKTYRMGTEEVHALSGLSIEIEQGEYVAIIGPSGSGKSTLMNLIGCLDTPTRGSYLLNEKDVGRMNDDELARIRNEEIGFVFQTFNLLPRATALHNVELPLIYAGLKPKERSDRARRALHLVDLGDRMNHRPNELSGGQRQRVAIARTLLLNPRVLIFDDSTSSVDMRTEFLIQEALQNLMEGRTTFVIAQRLRTVQAADQIIVMRDGQIVERGKHEELLENGGLYREIYDLELRDQEVARAAVEPS